MRLSARLSGDIICCDGIDDGLDDDSTDEAQSAVVEKKKTRDISPLDMRMWSYLRKSSPTSRDVRHACEAGEQTPRVTSLLFRPLLRIASCPPPRSSSDPH